MSAAFKVELSKDQLRELARMQAEEAAKLSGPSHGRLLTFEEAGENLGVSESSIRRRVEAGTIKTVPSFPSKISPREIDRLLEPQDA